MLCAHFEEFYPHSASGLLDTIIELCCFQVSDYPVKWSATTHESVQSHRICHFFLGKMNNQMHCFRTGRGARRSNFTLSLEGILMRDKCRWLWGLITFPFWKLSRVGLAPLSQPTEIRSLANFNTPFSRQGCSLNPRYADLGLQDSSSLACSWTQRPPVFTAFYCKNQVLFSLS